MKDEASGHEAPLADKKAKISDLQRRIAELRARLPKHSAPTEMMLELDELEDTLQKLCNELGANGRENNLI